MCLPGIVISARDDGTAISTRGSQKILVIPSITTTAAPYRSRNLLNRFPASSKVASFLQKANRTCLAPSRGLL
jgi:hypothetical protein